jgi:predicted PurR-regulated permease PerM
MIFTSTSSVSFMQGPERKDLARTTFQLLALGTLIAASIWIIKPFLVPLTWAITIAVATWPLLLRLQALLGGRRSLAVASMTVALLLVLVVPLYFGIATVVSNSQQIVDWSESVAKLAFPEPPAWLETLPLVGPKLVEQWHEVAAAQPEGIWARLAPLADDLGLWFVGQVGSIGMLLVHFLLTVIFTAILYSNGEGAASTADRFARRLAGSQGATAVQLAAQAVRAVALGVVGTAFFQSFLSGIGLAIAGVPFAPILTVVMFILSVAQIGVWPVLVLAVIWVYKTSSLAWGTGFLIWAVFCSVFDNFLRPLLIRRGANLPLLLIFAGVIGGLVAFGVVGLFIGPTVLAVAYKLLANWTSLSAAADDGPS